MDLGDRVRDKITGFKGTITGIVVYISGCNQALVVPSVDKEGKLLEGQWFDVQRLEVIVGGKISLENKKNGFDLIPNRNY